MSIIPQRGFSSTKAVYSINSNERRQNIINFLKKGSLKKDQIKYYSHCIVEYYLMQENENQHRELPEDERIKQKDILEEEPTLSEDEIKLFITIYNSSLLSPIEYQYFYDKFSKKEVQETEEQNELQDIEEQKKLQYA